MVKDIRELKREYEGEWLAIEVTERKDQQPIKGKLIGHNKDRRELHNELRKREVLGAYLTYAGPLVRPGYEASRF